MMLLSKKSWLMGVSSIVLSAQALANTPHEQLIIPHCLQDKLTINYDVVTKNNNYSVIDVSSADVDAVALAAHKVKCGKFVNITGKLVNKDAKNLLAKYSAKPKTLLAKSYKLSQHSEVNALIPEVNSENIWATLEHLTSYRNRSATEETGVETARWLKEQFDNMAKSYGRSDVNSYYVETGFWYKQPSVVTVIGNDLDNDAVVIGAHMDTLSGNMPGAGDDGSGSSSAMEVARVLLSSKKLNHPVYIIWYAAEERGLVGSSYVVEDFIAKKIPVKAAIQFDMTGFRNDPKDQTMWVYTDYTDPSLNSFVKELITTYVKVPVDTSKCGYGCSDHASWMAEGIPASFPCETDFPHHNPYIHSSQDRKELLSLEHMTNFAKLGVAFAVELAS